MDEAKGPPLAPDAMVHELTAGVVKALEGNGGRWPDSLKNREPKWLTKEGGVRVKVEFNSVGGSEADHLQWQLSEANRLKGELTGGLWEASETPGFEPARDLANLIHGIPVTKDNYFSFATTLLPHMYQVEDKGTAYLDYEVDWRNFSSVAFESTVKGLVQKPQAGV